MARYIRLDNFAPVPSDAQILWGVWVRGDHLSRYMLHREPADGRVPYAVLSISDRNAVRVVEEGTPAARSARLAYLILRDQGRCFYCWRELLPAECTCEHLVAVAHGGPEHASNLLLSCLPCNRMAGALSGAEKTKLAVERRLGTMVAAVLTQNGSRLEVAL